jgi:hypothetical protein
MAIRRSRQKLVAFFEVRDEDGKLIEEPTPWADHLAELSREPADDRKHSISEVDHWGQVYTYHDTDHLVLARLRDGVSSYNTSTGEIIDSESDIGKPWVEVSVIHFLPGTNRLGFVLGSNASPRVSSLATWINMHRIFEQKITIEPVIAKDVLAKLRGAAEASMLHVVFESSQLEAIHSVSHLYDASRSIKDDIGHISVEMVLKVEGGIRGRERDRVRLLDAAKGVAGHDFKKAVAKLINYDAQGKPHSEEVNFLKHRLARKMLVNVTDKEGNPVRISSAIEAIYRATERLRNDLYDA